MGFSYYKDSIAVARHVCNSIGADYATRARGGVLAVEITSSEKAFI